jgi:GNAT superfamily N-acetyltransferase
MRITVRPLQEADLAEWDALFDAYVRFYEADVTDDVIALTWQRLLSGQDGLFGLAAAAGGRLIGIAHALFHRSTWSPTFYCYLEDLFVDPGARGQGVGRALIEAVYREADANGCTRTCWATKSNNTVARRLYDGLATLSPFVQYRRG